MKLARIIGIILTGTLFVLGACPAARQAPATAQVNIDFTHEPIESWRPSVTMVSAGGVVTWLNTGNLQHAVVSGEGLFNQSLSPGQAFKYTFTHSGNFTYNDGPNTEVDTIVVK